MLPDTEKYLGYTIRYSRDDNPEDPLDDDRLGTMAFCHKRYRLGDMSVSSFEEIQEDRDYKDGLSLPIYMYDHSGYTIRTTPFSCPWDSGLVGYIYASREKIRKEFNVKRITKAIREKVFNTFITEVATYDAYLRGEIYEYYIYKEWNRRGVCLDTCGGFVIASEKDEEYLRQQARMSVEWHANQELQTMAKEQAIDSFPQIAD